MLPEISKLLIPVIKHKECKPAEIKSSWTKASLFVTTSVAWRTTSCCPLSSSALIHFNPTSSKNHSKSIARNRFKISETHLSSSSISVSNSSVRQFSDTWLIVTEEKRWTYMELLVSVPPCSSCLTRPLMKYMWYCAVSMPQVKII